MRKALNAAMAVVLAAFVLVPFASAGAAPKATSASASSKQAPKDTRGNDTKAFWKAYTGSLPNTRNGHAKTVKAHGARTYSLNESGLRGALAAAPREFTAAARQHPTVIAIPAPNGKFQRFAIAYSPIMQAGLAKQHPEIRTYAGYGLDDPTATVRLSMTPLGFQAMVRGSGTSWYVDPTYHLDRSLYSTYLGPDLVDTHGEFVEKSVARHKAEVVAQGGVSGGRSSAALVGGTLRVYRLALVTDPGYSTYWGGPANVTAAKVQLMNRVDMAYEDDESFRLDLVASNDLLNLNTYAQAIGRNGPCGNAACFSLANISSCSSLNVIGPAIARILPGGAGSYDIGHLALGAPGGGVAGLGVVGGGSKASGCTGIPEPDGDYYAIDYVAHEMGHQFSMNHTFGGNLFNCSGGNRNNGTSVEPGSGSSIMAYAGICQQDDLQPHSDPYFSQRSSDETQTYTSSVLNNLNEAQQSAILGFGGGNEVQQVTFGPGYAQAANVRQGPIGVFPLSSTIAGVSMVGHTVQVNTCVPPCAANATAAHRMNVGDSFTIAGVTDPNYNGTFTVTGIGPASSTFRYTLPGFSDLAPSGGGTVTPTVTGATESGTTVTITTTANHGFSVNNQVVIAGMGVTGYNGTFTIASVPTPTTFTYTAGTAGLAPSGGGTATVNSPFNVNIGGSDSALIGGSGLAYTAGNVQSAINTIPGFAGTVVVTGLASTGFTVTYLGASAYTDVPNLSLTNLGCGGCFSQVAETNHGGTFDSTKLTYAAGPGSATVMNIPTSNIWPSAASTVTPTGAAEAGNVVTVTTTANHNLAVGESVTVAGVVVGGYNGTFTVLSVPNGTSFTYHNPVTGLASSGSGTVTPAVAPGASESGNTVTLTTAFPHNLTAGNLIVVSGVGVAGYNGVWTVASAPTPTTLTYTAAASGLASSGGGTLTPFGPGTYTASGIQAALQGDEVQVVSLNNYTVDGRSYTLNYGGPDSVPITRGGNNTAAGIQAAIAGGNEQQLVTLSSFNGTTQSFRLQYNGNQSSLLGTGGAAINNTNVAAAINGIAGFPGTATVSGAANNNPAMTVTLGGGLANTDALPLSVVSCTGACTSTVRETAKGTPGILALPAGASVSVANVTDTGYTISYIVAGNQPQPTLTNGTGGVTGTVVTNLEGASGILPAGATGTAAGVANSGFTVTFGGALAGALPAGATVGQLGFTNLTGSSTGYFGTTIKGGPAGNGGFQQLATGNTPPSVSTAAGFTIPYQTPFTLTSSANDPDGGQTLTYMWEQNNTGPANGNVLTSNAKTSGALFRQFGTALDRNAYNVHTIPTTFCSNGENCTTTDPSRTFPDLQQIIANNTNAKSGTCPHGTTYDMPQTIIDCWSEWLPTTGYTGPMNFRITVRDGAPGAGGSDFASTVISLAPGTGPFLVTSPDTAVTYPAGSNQNITWDVAGTSGAPINAANVKISLSSDGGQTFPTVLAASTPNDGSENLALPNVPNHNGRIKIEAVGNVFFDISDADFVLNHAQQTITFAQPADHTYGDPDFQVVATASSGLPVSFTTSGQCTNTGDMVHITGAGSCAITAHQPGQAPDWDAAPDVTRTITINKANQTITFPAQPHRTWGDPDSGITGASASSGLPLTFAKVSGKCSVTTAGVVHFNQAGTCVVSAHQGGNVNYNPAPTVQQNVIMDKAPQTITFPQPPNKTFGDPDFQLVASSSSGLTVKFQRVSGPCQVTRTGVVHLVGPGSCTVKAMQGGNKNYLAAPGVNRTFTIN